MDAPNQSNIHEFINSNPIAIPFPSTTDMQNLQKWRQNPYDKTRLYEARASNFHHVLERILSTMKLISYISLYFSEYITSPIAIEWTH